MLNKVKAYITKHDLLLHDGLYLVALSGGADSVCLLRLLKEFGYRIEAVHCNFNLRGEESDRDETFCEQLCMEQKVPFHRVHFDTREYAELHKVSIEMAARELRYSYFERLRVVLGAEDTVVAHHRDDNIETLLLNLIRGTGIHGMEGIKPRNGHIVRPLLCISREEITEYLDSIGQVYITDSSNLVDDVQRNKLRLNIIPLLNTVNPSALDNIQKSMEHISEAVKVYDQGIAKGKVDCVQGNVISLPALLGMPSPETVLYEILKDYGFSGALTGQIFDNIDAPVGKYWQSGQWTLAKDRSTLIIGKTPQPLPEARIIETGTWVLGDYKLKVEAFERGDDFMPSREPYFVTIDADKVRFPLTVRPVSQGDSFVPFGMKGRKLVSDYLTDLKSNYFERQQQLVVLDSTDTIVWVVGKRVSQQSSVGNSTINILGMRYLKA